MVVTITLNGDRFEMASPATVSQLLAHLEIDARRVAVEHNLIVLKRDANVEVVYQLLRHDGNWQVYDVVIEGVSLVNNYRTQFNNIISHESYEALLKKLKLKLEQERAAAPPIKG